MRDMSGQAREPNHENKAGYISVIKDEGGGGKTPFPLSGQMSRLHQ